MKSIMEEASSIFKAIEKGWNSAGQPKEFTIKIFEEPQKNFIGMTVRPAKIGIFFTELQQKAAEQPAKKKKAAPQEERQRPEHQAREQRAKPVKQKEMVKKEPPKESKPENELKQGPIWTDEMIGTVKDWISSMLPLMNLDHVPFTINAQHFHLKIQFQKNLYDESNRQKYLFSSLSTLLLTMLKRHYKRPLKGYKIVLFCGE